MSPERINKTTELQRLLNELLSTDKQIKLSISSSLCLPKTAFSRKSRRLTATAATVTRNCSSCFCFLVVETTAASHDLLNLSQNCCFCPHCWRCSCFCFYPRSFTYAHVLMSQLWAVTKRSFSLETSLPNMQEQTLYTSGWSGNELPETSNPQEHPVPLSHVFSTVFKMRALNWYWGDVERKSIREEATTGWLST